MSVLELLGLKRSPAVRHAPPSTTLAHIVERLEHLPAERARFVASLAVVLARVASADLEVSSDEQERMRLILQELGDLPEEQARLVADLATERRQLQRAEYLAARELRDLTDEAGRLRVLDCVLAVCAADDSITLREEHEVRQVSSELGLTLEQFTAARARFADKREVLRGLP